MSTVSRRLSRRTLLQETGVVSAGVLAAPLLGARSVAAAQDAPVELIFQFSRHPE